MKAEHPTIELAPLELRADIYHYPKLYKILVSENWERWKK